MKFQYYRFFLSPIDGNLFAQLPDSRTEAINYIFNNCYTDFYKNVTYSLRKEVSIEDMILYKLAKHTSIQRIKPPEENFECEQIDHWPYINMIVGLNSSINNDYGQIIALEVKKSVISNPITILRRWADKLNNELIRYGYTLSINPISVSKNFWTIVNQYKNAIEEVVFEYSMPNLFNTGDKLEEELKMANQSVNASKASIVLSNKSGVLNLSEDNAMLQQSAYYIENGGGEFKIKTKGEKAYIMSASKIKTQKFDIENLNIEAPSSQSLKYILESILQMGEI